MMKPKWVWFSLLTSSIVVLVFATRWLDGPIGTIPGGVLQAGALVTTPVDSWEFAAAVKQVEFELNGRSRTVWIIVDEDNQAYLSCGMGFPPFKSWHQEALADPKATLRIDGRRYRVTLERVLDTALYDQITARMNNKYPSGFPGDATPPWFFRITSR